MFCLKLTLGFIAANLTTKQSRTPEKEDPTELGGGYKELDKSVKGYVVGPNALSNTKPQEPPLLQKKN